MNSGGGAVAGVLFTYLLVGIVYAVVVWITARKRGVNPWVWAIPTVIPVFGMLVGALFMLLSFLSALDRLNDLERKATFS